MSLSPFSDHFKKPSTLHTTRIFFNTTVGTSNLPIYTVLRYYVWNRVSKLKITNMWQCQTLRLYLTNPTYKETTFL